MNIVRVALDLPLPRLFDYLAPDAVESDVGRRVTVPFGKGLRTGVIVELADGERTAGCQAERSAAILRDMPALPAEWLALCDFCARYYQTPLGEVTSFALPPMLRRGKLPRIKKPAAKIAVSPAPTFNAVHQPPLPRLMPAQQAAVSAIFDTAGFHVMLLHGVTGSGKTEVYLRLDRCRARARRPGADAGAGDRPDAAARRPRRGTLPRRAGRLRQQRHGRRGARAGFLEAHGRTRRHRARHPARGVHAHAAPA
jgi:primosomal protein N'